MPVSIIILEATKERYNVQNAIVVEFDPEMKPLFCKHLGKTTAEHIFLLDENGGKVGEVKVGEIVRDALDRLGEAKKEVLYILSLEAGQIALAPFHV